MWKPFKFVDRDQELLRLVAESELPLKDLCQKATSLIVYPFEYTMVRWLILFLFHVTTCIEMGASYLLFLTQWIGTYLMFAFFAAALSGDYHWSAGFYRFRYPGMGFLLRLLLTVGLVLGLHPELTVYVQVLLFLLLISFAYAELYLYIRPRVTEQKLLSRLIEILEERKQSHLESFSKMIERLRSCEESLQTDLGHGLRPYQDQQEIEASLEGLLKVTHAIEDQKQQHVEAFDLWIASLERYPTLSEHEREDVATPQDIIRQMQMHTHPLHMMIQLLQRDELSGIALVITAQDSSFEDLFQIVMNHDDDKEDE